MSKNNIKGLFEALNPSEPQKERIYNRILSNSQDDAKEHPSRRARWLHPALAGVVLCMAFVLGVSCYLLFTPRVNGDISENAAGSDNIAMLFTVAKVIEVYSPRSVLVEIVEENLYNADTDKNLFLVGDIVQADFNEDIVRYFTTGDIVIIGRGNTAKVDYSEKPYTAQCNNIRIKAKEDYRNIGVGAGDEKGAEDAGLAFAQEVYGTYLADLPEDNSYRITDYRLLDYLLIEATDNTVSAEFSFAVKAVDEAYYSGPYTLSGTGEYEGWLILRKCFTLEHRNNAYWNCIKLEDVEIPNGSY